MSCARWVKSGALLLLLAVRAGAVEAAAVYSDTVLVREPEFVSVMELPSVASGTYRVTVTDLKWLDVSLQALSFGVFSATAPIKQMVGAGTLEFFNAGSGKIFLQLYARPGMSRSAGLVGLHVDSVAVVPLPASLLLLLSALGAAALWRWLERSRGGAEGMLAPAGA